MWSAPTAKMSSSGRPTGVPAAKAIPQQAQPQPDRENGAQQRQGSEAPAQSSARPMLIRSSIT